MRAYDFYSKIGMNTQLHFGYQTPSQIINELKYLGVSQIRDSLFSASDIPGFEKIMAAGIKQHLELQGWINPAPNATTWLRWIKQMVGAYPRKVVGVSGPNEVDNVGCAFVYGSLCGIPAANQAQIDIYNGVKNDPQLKNIAVDMWPLAFATDWRIRQQVGNMSAYCTRANVHDYYFADNDSPSVSSWGDMQVQIPLYLANYQHVCNHAAWVSTETGWQTPYTGGGMFSKEVNEDVQAKLLLINYFDHAMLPNCQAVYSFALQDEYTPGWGVFNVDGTPKEAAGVIRNLMSILNDPSVYAATFTPASLKYSLSGMPSASGNFVVQKSTGAFDIIIWNETPIWSLSSETQLSIPTSTINVTLPGGSSGYVYNPVQSATPIAEFNNVSRLSLHINDSPLIVEIQ
jgi:hypothetical protein